MMDTLALETFITAARLGSISEAAEAMHITQPAVSKRIQLLEEQLGVLLFDRINRRIQLTDQGRLLVEQGQDILLQIKNLEANIKQHTGSVSGILSIAVSHHVGLHRLPPYLKKFSKSCPDVELDLRFTDSEIACQEVENGNVELAVITLPPHINHKLDASILWPDPLSVVVAKESNHKGRFSLRELAELPAILPTDKTYTGRLILNAFSQHKLVPNIAMATNYLETIKMMVSIGLAWSVLPKSMLDDSLAVLKTDLELERQLGFVKHRQRTLSHAAEAFIAVLES